VTDVPLIIVESLVALGTLSLAGFTYLLAQSTKRDVEAQWRPLLVPGQIVDVEAFGERIMVWAFLADDGDFRFGVKNVGKGAALDLLAELGLGAIADCEPPENPVVAVNETTPVHGGRITLEDLHQSNNRVEVTVIYNDLAGNRHETFVVYRRRDDDAPWEIVEVTPQPPEYFHPVTEWRRRVLHRLRHPFRAVKRWWLRNPIDNTL
jgi:hypothetical protein